MDERRDVRQLDRDSRAEGELAIRRGEVDEERAQALAACRDRVPPDRRDEPRMALDRRLEALLELVEVGRGLVEDGLGAQGRSAMWSATVPPPSSR